MGDRAHVIIQNEPTADEPDNPLYIYCHNYGRQLPRIVATAMRRGEWRARRDGAYTARLIIDEIAAHQLAGSDDSPDDPNGDHQIGIGVHTSAADPTNMRHVKLHYGPFTDSGGRDPPHVTVAGGYDPEIRTTFADFIDRFAYPESEYAAMMRRAGFGQ